MTADEARGLLADAALDMLKPCLWHGVDGGPTGPQPVGGTRFCSQCARRHDRMVVDPRLLLLALEVEIS